MHQTFHQFPDSILDRFGVVLGRQLGVIFGLFGAQVRPSSVQNAPCKLVSIKNANFRRFQTFFALQGGLQNAPRSAQEGSKRLLESQKRLEPFILNGLVNIHVFDEDKLSRRVLDRTWPNLAAQSAENDPKLAPQNDPKSIKNRCQKTIEILIDNKTIWVQILGRPGGMRWPPGGGYKLAF